VRAKKWRSAAVDLVFAGKVSRVAETNLLRLRLFANTSGRASRHLADVESLTLVIQPILKGDELFDL
jgi:hypothetical protein